MAGTKFSDDLGLNHYKKAKKLKHFIHLRLTNWPKLYIPSTPNNSNETHTFMCLGRTGRFGQR